MASIARDKYQYHEIITIIKDLWIVIPDDIKADNKIAFTVPDLVIVGEDVDDSITENFLLSLTHFLNDYSVAIQEEILRQIIFKLVSTSKESHVNTCLKTVEYMGLKPKAGQDYMTKEHFKRLLLREAANSVQIEFEKVSQYITNNEVEEEKFKRELINDKQFIAELLVNVTDSLLPFLKWALQEESKINAFKASLSTSDFLDDIYQRRLLHFCTFCDANKLFGEAMMDLNAQQVAEVQSRVKDNVRVLNLLLLNSMGSVGFARETFFTEALSFTTEEETSLMRKFLYDPETVGAVYEMILDLENFDSSFLYPRNGAKLMLRWNRFIIDMVKPYTESTVYEALLLDDRENLISACHEKVRNHPNIRSDNVTVTLLSE